MLILAIKNLNDKPFKIEKKYSSYDNYKNNFAVIIYSHNNKNGLLELVNELKMQDYPLANFKVYAILDNCNDHSEELLTESDSLRVLNLNDGVTVGKDQAISILLESLRQDTSIESYVFIDSNRYIEEDFLNTEKRRYFRVVFPKFFIDSAGTSNENEIVGAGIYYETKEILKVMKVNIK